MSSTLLRGMALGLVALATALPGCAGAPGAADRAAPASYSFWPLFPAEPRVQFLVSYRFSEDVEPTRSGLEELILGEERRVLPIAKPYGVAMWDGKIYVCDIDNSAVVVLDLDAQETRVMGASGMARLSRPTDIAIAPDGTKYVSDVRRGAIFVFDAGERHVASFGFPGLQPTGLAVDGDRLYVGDFGANQVHALDRRTGEQLLRFGEKGDGDGQFVRPLGVDVDRQGNVYVSDVIRCRVQKFSPDGAYLGGFGQIGDRIGTFVRPKHIAVDGDGIVYVVDAGFANVQMFDDQQRLLMFFGSGGAHPGSMKLPVGITVHDGDLGRFERYVHPAFEARRLVIVTNQFGLNKVSVYAFGGLREGRTVRDVSTAIAPMPTGLSEERAEGVMPAVGGAELDEDVDAAPDDG